MPTWVWILSGIAAGTAIGAPTLASMLLILLIRDLRWQVMTIVAGGVIGGWLRYERSVRVARELRFDPSSVWESIGVSVAALAAVAAIVALVRIVFRGIAQMFRDAFGNRE